MSNRPRQLGPLTLGTKVSNDGAVETWSGHWHGDGAEKPVFIHRLHDWLASDHALRPAVEARIADLRSLRHPRLVRLFDYIAAPAETPGEPDECFIVEEQVRGTDLLTVLQAVHASGQRLPPQVFLHIAIQLCTSVEALHNCRGAATGASSMLHHGLRPQAAWVSVEGSVRLGGYGILASHSLLPAGAFRGPVTQRTAFLAPEQVDDARELSRATDIFSLGAVLYTLLTGGVLFDAPSDLQAVWAIREAKVGAQLAATRALVPGIEAVLARCLDPRPSARYPTVVPLRDELKRLADHYETSGVVQELRDLLQVFGFHDVVQAPNPVAVRASPAPVVRAQHPLAADIDTPDDEPTAEVFADDAFAPDGDLTAEAEDVGDDPTVATDHSGRTPVPSHLPFSQSLLGAPPDVPPENIEPMDDVGPPIVRRGAIAPLPEVAPSLGRPWADDPEPAERTARSITPPPAMRPKVYTTPTPEIEPVDDRTVPGVTDPTDPLPHPAHTPSPEHVRAILQIAGRTFAAVLVAFPVGLALSAALRGYGEPVQVAQPADLPPAELATIAPLTPSAPPDGSAPPAAAPAVETTAANVAPPAAVEHRVVPPAPTPTLTVVAAPKPAETRPTTAPADTRPVVAPPPASTPPADAGWQAPTRLSDTLGTRAAQGRLTADDRALLEGLPTTHPDYSRGRVWLYDDATSRGALAERKRHIDALLAQPENTSNPVYLTEAASVALARRDWSTALAHAKKAEAQWARSPSAALYGRQSVLYEQQARALDGLYGQRPSDELRRQTMTAWERLKAHVTSRDARLAAEADAQISRLAALSASAD